MLGMLMLMQMAGKDNFNMGWIEMVWSGQRVALHLRQPSKFSIGLKYLSVCIDISFNSKDPITITSLIFERHSFKKMWTHRTYSIDELSPWVNGIQRIWFALIWFTNLSIDRTNLPMALLGKMELSSSPKSKLPSSPALRALVLPLSTGVRVSLLLPGRSLEASLWRPWRILEVWELPNFPPKYSGLALEGLAVRRNLLPLKW